MEYLHVDSKFQQSGMGSLSKYCLLNGEMAEFSDGLVEDRV